MIKKNIMMIVGSLREESFNRILAQEAEAMIGDRANVSFLDFSDVPFLNQDIEFPTPEPVARLRREVAQADGLWVFTPEYNMSYPGHLKNMFDWLSRPVSADKSAEPTVIAGKKMTMSGAGGMYGTAKGREKLTELLTMIKADVMPTRQTGVILNTEAWTEGRMILTEDQRKLLEEQVEAFIEYIQ